MRHEDTELPPLPLNQPSIKDVSFVSLETHVDDRGYLIEIIREIDPYMHKFGQVYIVGDPARGTIRAFHKHLAMWDYFFISQGSAKFVLVDDREDCPTYGVTNLFVISARNPSLLAVPPGVYHGWMSLEGNTNMISIASEVYNRDNPDEIRIHPDSFGDVWTVRGR